MINKVVDISSVMERKIEALQANKTQIRNMALQLRDNLAKRNLTLPWFSADDSTIIKEYVDLVFRTADQRIGQQYGLDYAEVFHYIGPGEQSSKLTTSSMNQYLAENAIPLKK